MHLLLKLDRGVQTNIFVSKDLFIFKLFFISFYFILIKLNPLHLETGSDGLDQTVHRGGRPQASLLCVPIRGPGSTGRVMLVRVEPGLFRISS